jgi:crotonobetainyl-CoA:carnitine CoA-transferase CaiB-like acyl-CoA transferase
MRLSDTPPVRRGAGPQLGADTEAVLTAAGFQPEAIRELAESGIVACGDDGKPGRPAQN